MTTLIYHDYRWDNIYTVFHDRGTFLGAEMRPPGATVPAATFFHLSDLPLPVRNKIESILCQPSKN